MTLAIAAIIKGSFILAGALLAMRLLRRRSAAFRHSVLLAAIVCAAAMPVFDSMTPVWELRILPAPVVQVQAQEATFIPEESIQPPTREPRHQTTSEQFPDNTASVIRPERSLRMVWFAGAAFGIALLIAGIVRVAWLGFRAKPVTSGVWPSLAIAVARSYGLRRSLRLCRTGSSSVLAVWGTIRPGLLLPAGAENWREDRILAVLYHELAHVRRYDWLTQVVAAMARAIYWFNPLFWIACSRLRQESEQACDDAAVAMGGAATDYASHLLAVARTLNDRQSIWAPALPMARPSTLQRRIAAMLNPAVDRRGVTPLTFFFIGVLLLSVVLPMAALEVLAKSSPAVRPTVLAPAPSPQPAKIEAPVQERGAVEGIVVRNGGSEGLEGVRVILTSANPLPDGGHIAIISWAVGVSIAARGNPQYEVFTGSDGRFRIPDVPAGRYVLSSHKNGYSAILKAPGPAEFVNVPSGGRVRNIRIELLPISVVSGRVLDQSGQPVEGVEVDLLLESYLAGSRRFQAPGRPTTTDGNGEFRRTPLAGEYLLVARAPDGRRDFAPTYYPGVSSIDEAVKVVVPPGQDLHGLSFRLTATPLHSVRFTLAGTAIPADQPIRIITQMLRRDGFAGQMTEDFDSLGANRYVVPRLAPGRHQIEVLWGPGFGDPQPRPLFSATIVDRDVDLGTIDVGPLHTIRGRVTTLDPGSTAVQRLETVLVTQTPINLRRAPLANADRCGERKEEIR